MNTEHYEILMKGVDIWNQWREDNPDIVPDLRWANLYKANLSKADLSKADLSWANLSKADLTMANLYKANLIKADLDFACWPLWCGSINVKRDDQLNA